MPDGMIRLDQNGVANLATTLVTKAEAAMNDLAALANQADPQDVWNGQAATSYQTAFETWHKAQIEAQRALEQLGRAVTTINNNFAEVNTQGAAAFDQFFGA